MNHRRDLLKAMVLVPLAACTRTVETGVIPDAGQIVENYKWVLG